MTRTSLHDVTCSIARTVDVLGDAWAWLIIRDLFLGIRRFDDLCADIGISRKVLAARLRQLADAGLASPSAESSGRLGYELTPKGAELVPVLAAIMAWGDRWEATPAGPPLILRDERCGGTGVHVACAHCGEPVTAATLTAESGPGGSTGPGTALLGELLGGRSAGAS